MFDTHYAHIHQLIQEYFDGLFFGDVQKLQNAFHAQALLFGDIHDQPYFKNKVDFLEAVKNRNSPSSLGESMRMKIISIEVLGNLASVRAQVPMFNFVYTDILSLVKQDGRWLIVNKLFYSEKP